MRKGKKRKGLRESLYIFYVLGTFQDTLRLPRCSFSWWIEFFFPQLQRVLVEKETAKGGIRDMGISPEGKGGCTPVCRPQWEAHDTSWNAPWCWQCTGAGALTTDSEHMLNMGDRPKGVLPAESVSSLYDC